MTASIIITICILLLLAYVFDVTSPKTRIPSIILLLVLGWFVKQGTELLKIEVPNLEPVLPVLGTIGLILIVLDGSLELELKRSNLTLIGKSTLLAIIPLFALSFALASAIFYFDIEISFKDSLTNAIPLAVISSAVAISSAKNLRASDKEFITYESSLSDVFGVIFFNFVTLHEIIDSTTFGYFFLEILMILIISFVSTIALSFLLSKIRHRVKFVPIIIFIIMIYFISKKYHLPALLFIVLFGLLVGNIDELKRFKFVEKLRPDVLNVEINKFKELTTEFTFLIRALFFILFGFLIKTRDLLNPDTIIWAVGICVFVFILRSILLIVLRLPQKPLLFISPRGLITILLFLSIPTSKTSSLVNNSLIVQVIVLTALIMMIGLMFSSNKEKKS